MDPPGIDVRPRTTLWRCPGLRFCIVYPYATWFSGKPCGGAEKQVGLLARHLARRGNDVTFLALDHRGPERVVDGVNIRLAWEKGAGTPWLGIAMRRHPGLTRLVAQIDADLYYVRGAQAVARLVIDDAHKIGSRALLALASDRNLTPESGRMLAPGGHGPLGGVTGRAAWHLLQLPALRAADVVVAQNDEQAARCAAMGLSHALVPSIVEPPPEDRLESQVRYDVIWAGNVHNPARRSKGVQTLLALVRSLPAVRFAVVGALRDVSLSAAVVELERSANVELFGKLMYDETQALLARSRLVLNTSPAEGFSNVMLEGWALGKPSVTLAVNPSGLLADRRWPPADSRETSFRGALGACAGGDIAGLSHLVTEALGDERVLRNVGRRCRSYVAETHDADAVCARYEDLAEGLRYIR